MASSGDNTPAAHLLPLGSWLCPSHSSLGSEPSLLDSFCCIALCAALLAEEMCFVQPGLAIAIHPLTSLPFCSYSHARKVLKGK